jgi:HAD superfamily hydrolase (TIGR01509 family)
MTLPATPPALAASARLALHAVIFDCDGTLVDSEGPAIDVLHELALAEGADLDRNEAEQRFRGVRMAECARWVALQRPVRPEGFEADFIRRVRLASEERFRLGLDALPGASDLLEQLARPPLALPFCIATNGPRDKVELTLALTGLRRHFGEHVYCAYEVGAFKPAPGLFLHAAQALGVAPAHCAVVEDSLPGIQAGLAAGMQVYALIDPAELPADLAPQVRCISTLAQFGTLLRATRPGQVGR